MEGRDGCGSVCGVRFMFYLLVFVLCLLLFVPVQLGSKKERGWKGGIGG